MYIERMAKKRIKRPIDPISLAKLIGDIATGQVSDEVEDGKNPAAVELGRLGGKKGGKARSAQMTTAEKKERATKAAAARWAKKPKA
jgi:hypothetical protein